jgi:hypothetical protein
MREHKVGNYIGGQVNGGSGVAHTMSFCAYNREKQDSLGG